MSVLTPNKIYEDFRNRRLSKSNASRLLMTLIENIPDLNNKVKILSIKFLGLITSKEPNVFKLLENLLVSDLNDLIRGNAAKVIIHNFPDKAKEPILWILQQEMPGSCLKLIIKALETISTPKLRSLLKLRDYVNFKGNIYFPSEFCLTFNLSGKNIDSIKKIDGLDKLTNLRKLYLNFNQITKINGLETLVNLNSLHLQNNNISKLRKLKSNPNLKSLQVFDNQISEIDGLEELKDLEILNLRNNKIEEIKGLDHIVNLKRLDLSNNQITDIKGLESLPKLEFLDLSHNHIAEIKGLKHLKKLKFLDLRNNKITHITSLKELRRLRYLYLGFNRIKVPCNHELSEHLDIPDIKNIEESSLNI